MEGKNFNNVMKFRYSHFYFLIFLLLCIGAYVYWNFLTFKKILMYTDIGGDSTCGFWPQLMNLHNGFPGWSFNIGLGQNAFQSWYFDPFLLIMRLFNKNQSILVLPYLTLIKILLAGIFFYLYLRTLSIVKYVSMIGAVSYAFCGLMIQRSNWMDNFTTAPVVTAFVLYSFEMFMLKKKWFLLPLAIASIPTIQSFYLWPYSILLFGYALFRYVEEHRFDFKKISSFFVKLIGVYCLGIVLSAVLFLPEFWVILQSPRSFGKESLFWGFTRVPLLSLSQPSEIFSGLLRLYSTDMMGTGDAFKGWVNYIESPLFYCGLPVLILMPQVFKFIRFKLKVLYALLLLCSLGYVSFNYPKLILYALEGYYYRIPASFVTIILLYLGMHALNFIEKKSIIDVGLLVMSLLLLLVPIVFSVLALSFSNNYILDNKIVKLVVFFLVLYTILIYTLKFPRFKFIGKILLLLVLCIELAIFSFNSVNNRVMLSSDCLKSKTLYFDYTNEAVAYLKSFDKDFYRIDKRFDSVSLNDALFQGWKGTKSYYQWNSGSTREFIKKMEIKQEIDHPNWIYGFDQRFKLNTLVGVKYLLTKSKEGIPYGYKYLTTTGDVDVYENTYYLPLGFTYDLFVQMEDFVTLSEDGKDATLLEACAWTGKTDLPEKYGLRKKEFTMQSDDNYDDAINKLRKNTLHITAYADNFIKGNISLDDDRLLFLSIPFDRGWALKVDGKKTKIEKVNIGFMGVFLRKGFHKIDLKYSVPFLRMGAIISCIGLFVYLMLLMRSSLVLSRNRQNR